MEMMETLPFDHDTYDTALNLLQEEGFVITMGPEKCGKTTIGRALQRHFSSKEYTPLDLHRQDEWNSYSCTEKHIVLLDEVFRIGDVMLDEAPWVSVFGSMREDECLIIVIIKTDMNPENVQNQLPSFLENVSKVFVRKDNLKNELFRVCHKGEMKDLRCLLRHGVDVNVVNDKGESPLHIACTLGHEDVVKLLLQVKPNVDLKDSQGQTPLHRACNRHDAAQVSLETGDITTRGMDDDHSKTSSRAESDVKEKSAMASVDSSDEKENTDFVDQKTAKTSSQASHHEKQDVTESQSDTIVDLLTASADPNVVDNEGRTPLHIACHNGNYAAVVSLLSARSKVDVKDQNGCTALHVACQHGNTKIMEELLRSNPTAEDMNETLHMACKYGPSAAVTLLIQYGVDIEAEGMGGVRPLHVASGNGKEEIVRILLTRRADVNAKTKTGKKPLDFAKFYGHNKVENLLKGAEKTQKNRKSVDV
ncbi:hypothetical protein BaRGS_00035016 [Batillaria attramentaria]|uniref:Novel STAND NTPase 3 domain-containing protein n=1 Tax=Batillaria attramentaria TaxID=370345 RepID=A0ABD0JFQ8_9CAEN